jgi:uncharacterized protein (DUF2147 family)
MKKLLVALSLSAAAGIAFAQATPVGLWKTIDDETKVEKSQVRITDSGGTLTGKIEKLFDKSKQDSVCEKCGDDRKGQPIVGMTIIRNAKANGEVWEGGDILDPNNGKVYKLRLKPIDGGKALEVRGYIGPFYRNQTWVRVE